MRMMEIRSLSMQNTKQTNTENIYAYIVIHISM
nr:MAG TPA: hypothetical protein [Caudoviricetes sp.]